MDKKFPSEIRRNPMTGEWVIVASSRSKRPGAKITGKKRKDSPISKCPFENPQKTGHGEALFEIRHKLKGDWSLQVINNKYPALLPGKVKSYQNGPFQVLNGIGHGEVTITRDHKKSLAQLGVNACKEMLVAFLQRSIALSNESSTAFVMCFINFGPTAGASITHPHGQIISLPIVPPDINGEIECSQKYFDKHKSCAYCTALKWEKKEKSRIIYENDKFISFVPYTAKNAFEINIFPKTHQSDFRKLKIADIDLAAEVLYDSLYRLYKAAGDPDYNLMIQTQPVKGQYPYFHWYITILPRTELPAGFELGTGMEICGLDSNIASQLLKRVKIKK